MYPRWCCEVEPDELPDLVLVTRCKDCVFYQPDEYDPGKGDCTGACSNLVKVSDDWYCPEGKILK